jgi:hypothetical protein
MAAISRLPFVNKIFLQIQNFIVLIGFTLTKTTWRRQPCWEVLAWWQVRSSQSCCSPNAKSRKGSYILSTLLSAPQVTSVDIIARRNPPLASSSTKLTAFIDADISKWAQHYKSLSSPPSILFSALATSRGAAGGFENQYRLEHGLNVEMAKTAREAGSKVCVLISSATASTNAMFAFSKMKGQIEEDIKALGFDHTIILRPGLLVGNREESRPAEAVLRKIAAGLGSINSHYLKDSWAQDADVIAKAAVGAALKALNGKAPGKVWVLNGRDIIREAQSEQVS